jgi:hypothetical protein
MMKKTIFAGSFQPRTISYGVLCMALLVFSSGVLTAQKDEHRVRNVVLVHGAWADGSGWRGDYDILTNDGYNVSIVQEPETSFRSNYQSRTGAVVCQASKQSHN